MPFCSGGHTWFGRHLSDQQMTEYLHDSKKRGTFSRRWYRLATACLRNDASSKQWYPDLIGWRAMPVEEVRNPTRGDGPRTPPRAGFHETLMKMLSDSSPIGSRKCGAVARALWGCDRASADCRVVQPARIACAFRTDALMGIRPGTPIPSGGLLAKLRLRDLPRRSRFALNSRAHSVGGAAWCSVVGGGREVAVVDTSTEQVWEALPGDVSRRSVRRSAGDSSYERDLRISNDVRQQAARQRSNPSASRSASK